MYHFAIHGVHTLTRDVALQVMTAINDGEPVSLCILEHAHDLGHGRGIVQDSSRLYHELRSLEMVVEFGAEHNMADFDDIDLAQQRTGRIGDGQHTMTRTRDVVDHLTQFGIGGYGLEVAIDNGVKTHQRQHSMVGMVGHQLALLSQTETVDAMRFEDTDGQIAGHSNNQAGLQHPKEDNGNLSKHLPKQQVKLWEYLPYLYL